MVLSPETDRRTLVVKTATGYNVLAMNPYSQSNLTLTFASNENLQVSAVYRTSEKEDWATPRSQDVATKNGSAWNLVLGTLSLTTFVFTKV